MRRPENRERPGQRFNVHSGSPVFRPVDWLELGERRPFDLLGYEAGEPLPAMTPARAAVLGVLANLKDRTVIRTVLADLEADVARDIVEDLTRIVEKAFEAGKEAQ